MHTCNFLTCLWAWFFSLKLPAHLSAGVMRCRSSNPGFFAYTLVKAWRFWMTSSKPFFATASVGWRNLFFYLCYISNWMEFYYLPAELLSATLLNLICCYKPQCLFSNVTTSHFHFASRKNRFRLNWIFTWKCLLLTISNPFWPREHRSSILKSESTWSVLLMECRLAFCRQGQWRVGISCFKWSCSLLYMALLEAEG